MSVKLLFLAGSSRQNSTNKKLAKAAARLAEEKGADVTYIDLADYPMPIYDGDLEADSGLPKNAIALKKLFIDCDGFFIASPEYNGSYSGLLKNTIDWLSRKHEKNEEGLVAFKGKTAAICSASPGALGGLRSLGPLRLLLSHIGVLVVPAQAAINHSEEAFDEKGQLIHDNQVKMVNNVITQLVQTASAL